VFEAPTVAALSASIDIVRRGDEGPLVPSIAPVPRTGDLPLSFAQQRLWFLDQLEGESAAYNIPAAVRLSGSLHVAALAASLAMLVQRHEALRTAFPMIEGTPVQIIAPSQPVALPLIDLQWLPAEAQALEVQRLATAEARCSFDLAQGPLLRVTLLRLGDAEHVLLVTLHHIVADGWSLGIVVREVAILYDACLHGQPSPLPSLPIQYADFAQWQRTWLQGEVLEAQLAYWRKQLAGAPPMLELPTDRSRSPVQTFKGAALSIGLGVELTQQLQTLSRQTGGTLYMTLLGAFAAFLSLYSGQEEVVIGSPLANRTRQETEGLIGFFVNTLPLRIDLAGDPTFPEILARVRQVTLEAFAHQDVPLEKLVEALQPERGLSHTPLFQVLFVLQNVPTEPLSLSGLTLTLLEIESGTAKFDLTLVMAETAQGLQGMWEYNRDLFDATTIARMARHFQTLLERIVS
jgi:hypothetical protein